MIFLRQRTQGFTQQRDLLRVHAGLARSRDEYIPLDADDVSNIKRLKRLVYALREIVTLDVYLDFTSGIQQVGKARLAHDAAGDHSPGNGDLHAVFAFLRLGCG
ncbi:hypothetical protein SDC9_166088 [bioreactor metagenome]|uniref:Uncharacterized protein n=1 Tax=bioreactor metagenome TaxID=1076179 RepID=A0A645FWA4_9ZZZZ